MVRSALGKVAWVGRTASMVFGLALVGALLLGVATMAFGANGDFFKVGKANVATAVSTLTKSGAGPALSLRVDSGPPLAVNSSTRVANLNADKLDGKDFRAFDATEVIETAGPLPAVGTFTSKGGKLIIMASGSGFRSTANAKVEGHIGATVELDGNGRVMVGYTNQMNSHKNFVSYYDVREGVAAGKHTIRVLPFNTFDCNGANEDPRDICTTTDHNDYFNVTVLEIPD